MTSVSTVAPSPSTGSGQRHLGWALVLITVAQLMVVLDASIANIALPYIGRDLDIAPANLSWIVTGYSLAFGGLLLLGGRLGDLYGRRRLFMIGVSLFAVASLVGGLAQSEIMLLCSRGMQGVGAAIASPAALALITTNFPAGPKRSRAFSVYATMSGVGAAVGLILGGWLTGLHPHLLRRTSSTAGASPSSSTSRSVSLPPSLRRSCSRRASRTLASSTCLVPCRRPSASSPSSSASPAPVTIATAGATPGRSSPSWSAWRCWRCSS